MFTVLTSDKLISTQCGGAGGAATKGARLCPQDQPQRAGTAQRVGVKQESLAVPTRCGWCSAHSRAPKKRHGSQRFPRILIEVVRMHRSLKEFKRVTWKRPNPRTDLAGTRN